MATIKIEVPDGKKAVWKNGVLTLVDEEKPKNVMDRIKTVDDAIKELGKDNILVKQLDNFCMRDTDGSAKGYGDILAFLQLRIVAAALNEGWEPKFTEGECRWYPWFYFYTDEEYKKFSDEKKRRCVGRSYYVAGAGGGLVFADASNASLDSNSGVGARLTFKSEELATYAGKQFIDLWADFVFKPRESSGVENKVSSASTINFEEE